ncbi:hypothetical protein LWC34_44805 [Kibdelosporangium philippinense]|uniref:Uncharacterized protein n=1 Tax=Kibdelosporangium philippinense TaxID=211113 RepID=A0ABS8ZQM3_9PSEU|nr:hypothetical protein [Kibdelosporangium philippinense]MCE7009879.1 hypothetical protein [Kibdelosporangium philippinense]
MKAEQSAMNLYLATMARKALAGTNVDVHEFLRVGPGTATRRPRDVSHVSAVVR